MYPEAVIFLVLFLIIYTINLQQSLSPAWTPSTTPEELHLAERTAFLDWRRHLAHLEEDQGLLMTPFEKNLEIWKQLWRVVERCDLLVQIVDARNPGLFRCPDLEAYVSESGDGKKKNLLLLNKADLLTVEQRSAWADYFDLNHIPYRFFSASLSKERQEAEKDRVAALEEALQADLCVHSDEDEASLEKGEESSSYVMVSDPGVTVPEAPSDSEGSNIPGEEELQEPTPAEYFSPLDVAEEDENVPARVRIWDAVELIELFKTECPVSLRESAPGGTSSFFQYNKY